MALDFQEPSLDDDDPQKENQSSHPDTSLMAVSWSRGQALDRRAQWLKEFKRRQKLPVNVELNTDIHFPDCKVPGSDPMTFCLCHCQLNQILFREHCSFCLVVYNI